MFARHPYRSPPPPPAKTPRGDDHARPLAWASAVLFALCLARIVYGLAHRRFDGEVLFAMALASAAVLTLVWAIVPRA